MVKLGRTQLGTLRMLARSSDLSERRIAMMSAFHGIRRGEFSAALTIAALLVDDGHDLIHRAVGWMLREIGRRDPTTERAFSRSIISRCRAPCCATQLSDFPTLSGSCIGSAPSVAGSPIQHGATRRRVATRLRSNGADLPEISRRPASLLGDPCVERRPTSRDRVVLALMYGHRHDACGHGARHDATRGHRGDNHEKCDVEVEAPGFKPMIIGDGRSGRCDSLLARYVEEFVHCEPELRHHLFRRNRECDRRCFVRCGVFEDWLERL